MKKHKNFALIFLGLFFVSGCTSEERLKALLVEHPEILIEVIQKNPERFARVFKEINTANPEDNSGKERAEELAQREQDFKNPKQPEIDPSRPMRGSAEARITVVSYTDFQCPFCAKGNLTMAKVIKKYPGKIRFLYKHYPLDLHPKAMPAAIRYEAIAFQNKDKAFRFYDEVFKNQKELEIRGESYLDSLAAKLGVDVSRMKQDMVSNVVRNRIASDIEEGKKFAITGTPGYLINGVKIVGARNLNEFEEIFLYFL
jgi:protein-disulfide isomerase